MSLNLEVLNSKLIEYQKARDALRVEVYRFFVAALKNKEIELRTSGGVLDEETVSKILKKQKKMRNETIEGFKQAGRAGEADKEQKELEILTEIGDLLGLKELA